MMPFRRNSPSQKALPLADWSKVDSKTWQAAQEAGGVLDDCGIASHLSEQTLKDLTRRYAYFLSFCAHQRTLDLEGPAAATVTEENILQYLHHLQGRVSPVTLAQSFYKISRVAQCLAPQRDWRWLQRIARRLDLRAKPRDKRNEVVPIRELVQLGLRLMDQAEKAGEATAICRALQYRDGLIIALLAADPLRLRNITALEIDRTLRKDGSSWSFDIPTDETKTRHQHPAILPDWSAPYIDRYVEHYRYLLLRHVESTNRLWLNQLGRPLSASSLYRRIYKRTHDAFGKRVNPHLFRSCFATSTAVDHGAEVGLAMTVLGHQSSKVFNQYYNQAKMIDAVRAYQDIVLADPQD